MEPRDQVASLPIVAATPTVFAPRVEVASDEDVRSVVRTSLEELGLTFDELKSQAEGDRFDSDLARRTWLAIADLAAYA